MFKIVRNELGLAGSPTPRTVTAGSAITANELVVRAQDDLKYDMVGDNGTKVTGLAISSAAADGDSFEMIPLFPWIILQGTYTGTYADTKVGTRVSINASRIVDLDDAGNDLLILDEQIDADTCNVYCIYDACTALGAEN